MLHLSKIVLDSGGTIVPLLIPSEETNQTGLCNPSIYVDGDDIFVNVRNVGYTLQHSIGAKYYKDEGGEFYTRWGPLSYLHPENDITLRTNNFFCEYDNKLNLITKYSLVDTTKLDIEPKWEFIGLEDARIVRWDSKLYLTGVRRDVQSDGQGRMELSEIYITPSKVQEISRCRIEVPFESYCDKNWMPILDMPYHYVRWANPIEIMKVNPEEGTSELFYKGEDKLEVSWNEGKQESFSGSSQVIPWDNGCRLAIIHECQWWRREERGTAYKDGRYKHRILLWDSDWNLIKYTDTFTFMGGQIEFCCGAAVVDDDLIISFGFQDNAAYLLKVNKDVINTLFNDNQTMKNKWNVTDWPTMEITTSIPKKGCVVDCVFCPQEILKKSYEGDRFMTMEEFKMAIDKLPTEIRITFSGFVEPWMNKHCSDMLLYAHNKGHRVSVFTTGIGMSLEDVEKIKDVPYCSGPNGGFTLHLPDDENLAKHPITDKYLDVLVALKDANINNFMTMSMGSVHESVKPIFPNVPTYEMWSRAGNLMGEAQLKPELLNVMDRVKSTYQPGDVTCGCIEDLYHNILLPNGDVSLCCMDYGLDHILGNLYEDSYDNIMPEENTCYSKCNSCENGITVKDKKAGLKNPHIYKELT